MKHLASILWLSAVALLCGCGAGPKSNPPPGNPSTPQAQAYTVLHTFKGGADGKNPTAGLIRDAAGNLYGTTVEGGDLACPDDVNGCGTVFKLDPSGVFRTLHAFAGGPTDGVSPYSGLIRDDAGNLYGTTLGGGTHQSGIVFKLDAAGSETVLHHFSGGAGGGFPNAGLIRDEAGNLYGATANGGDLACPDDVNGCGTVFKLDPGGGFTTLHVFAGGPTDGAHPYTCLIQDAASNLYGATAGGGAQGSGVVFQLDATGGEAVLYHFTGGADGAVPEGRLVRDQAGNLYGTTAAGGVLDCSEFFPGCGTVFKLDPGGVLTTLRVFGQRRTDLRFPSAGLIRDAAGNLYGHAGGGGAHGSGVVFRLDASGGETVLYHFTGAAEGTGRKLGVLDSAGNLYGTGSAGGDLTCHPPTGCGIVFKIKLP